MYGILRDTCAEISVLEYILKCDLLGKMNALFDVQYSISFIYTIAYLPMCCYLLMHSFDSMSLLHFCMGGEWEQNLFCLDYRYSKAVIFSH